MATAARDWASLPSPLLGCIAERLTAEAFVRVGAVCTTWASILSPDEDGRQPYYLPRSLCCPWLLVPSEHDGPTGSLTFLSLPDSLCPYCVPAADLLPHRLFGSHAGWLATVDAHCNLLLANPLTGARVPLPAITTLPAVGSVRDPASASPLQFLSYGLRNITELFTPTEFRDTYSKKMVLSASPSTSPEADCIAVLIFGHLGWLAFARAGDTAWSTLERPPKTCGYEDDVFADRTLYAVTDTGEVHAFDFSRPRPQPTVFAERIRYPKSWEIRYLVFSSGGGDLLQVLRERNRDAITGFKTSRFAVEKINLMQGEGNKRWITTEDLGCQSIFIGMGQSLSLSVQDIAGVRQSCIYYTDDDWDWLDDKGKQCAHDMGVFHLKEGSYVPLYAPDTWLTWPPPIWFTPILS